jgi:2-keto-3-deoxy-L-rhamnonate aldolase RhmA
MKENRVKSIIKAGGLAIGTYVSLADPAIVEIIGLAGYDAAFIDMEHTSFDLKTVEEMIRAADLVGITSIIRVPDNNEKTILRILDMGAQGIQVPHIANRADAEAAVKAVRYPPLGDRGAAGSSRAARYGTVPMSEHVATSNEQIVLSVMIEDMEALNDIEGIASIPGLDLIVVGPADMSRALGVLGTSNHPLLRSTVEKVAASIKEVGNARFAFAAGNPVLTLTIADLRALGVGYTNCAPGPEVRLLRSYQQEVKAIRAQMG